MAVVTLTAALMGCGGSSSASMAPTAVPAGATGTGVMAATPPPPATSGSPSGSSAGSTGSSGSGGTTAGGTTAGATTAGGTTAGGTTAGGTTAGATTAGGTGSVTTTTDILFEQPQESGVTGRLFVPPATHIAPPKGIFALILWQPNPNRTDGLLVPTAWDAGSQTGFTPSSASTAQLGFQNKVGTSTAQMDGDTVGAFINSADLPSTTAGSKMMVTPQFIFTPGNEPQPFASSKASLSGSMDLQIPTAVGKTTYAVADFEFIGPNGVRISYGVLLFHNGSGSPSVGSGYDAPSNSYMLNSPLGIDQRFVSKAQGSASAVGAPWLGWQHFAWSISETQFAAALAFLAAKYPTQVQSTDPSSYLLDKVHLNAEIHFPTAPAELGWSMRRWKVWITS